MNLTPWLILGWLLAMQINCGQMAGLITLDIEMWTVLNGNVGIQRLDYICVMLS